VFDHWKVISGNLKLTEAQSKSTTLKFKVTSAMCGSASDEKVILVAPVWKEKYAIFGYPNRAGYATVSGGGQFFAGKTATLKVTPVKGYRFVKWTDGVTDNPRKVKVVDSDSERILYAVVEPLTYTVQFNGNGATSGKTAAITLKYGQTKTLTANGFKKSGHSFKGWATSAANAKKGVVKYKNKASVKSLSTVLNKKVTLYAVCIVNSYSLTVKPNSTKYGSASKSGKYKYASMVKLTAKAKKGYYFYGWYKSDKKTLLSKSTSYTYKMGGATTVYAWFKANAVKIGTAFKDSY
jgi:hypothetical protein